MAASCHSGVRPAVANAVSRLIPVCDFCCGDSDQGLVAGVKVCPANCRDIRERTLSMNISETRQAPAA